MNSARPTYRKTRLEVTLGTMLGTLLAVLASVFLLAAVALGFWHNEMRIGRESRQVATQVNRAGNIAIAFFFATEGVAAWLLLRSGLLPFKLHWLFKFLGLWIGAVLCSYLLVLLSVRGEAPDLIFDLERVLGDWFMRIAA